jgi:type IV secretion system protein VirD4
MRNYAGHRLSPWLGHLMVSRQETSRALLTTGEVMQLPPDDELILVSGCPPIRARKTRYFEDRQLQARVLPPPKPSGRTGEAQHDAADRDWVDAIVAAPAGTGDPANSGIRREPELPEHEEIAPAARHAVHEFEPFDLEPDNEAQRARAMQRQVRNLARQTALDPADRMGL